MPGKLKKKGDVGKEKLYLSRNQSIRKLQLSLADFRRLCIYKGVFPREVNGKSKYYKKDINYLMHDCLIQFFRKEKIFRDKLKFAKLQQDEKTVRELEKKKPKLDLSLIIKERYPTFDDALKELDDALSMVFAFANIPSLRNVSNTIITECQKVSVEFLHFVIFKKCLRKVFISVKGYYFQVNINGFNVTWIIPHKLVPTIPKDVDFKIMKSFAEFYIFFLKFVNCHLYSISNVLYPPIIQGGIISHRKNHDSHHDLSDELLSSLNISLKNTTEDASHHPELDDFSDSIPGNLIHLTISNLFSNKCFYLSREIPKQPFVFAIRCCGGTVSWEDDSSTGVLFQENDCRITHQIVDRPHLSSVVIGRIYVQPQWIFDSINASACLEPEPYFIGSKLPPHLSPFESDIHKNMVDQYSNQAQIKTSESIVTTSEPNHPTADRSIVQRKLAVLALPRQKRKLFDKLMKIKKTKLKQKQKLESKKKKLSENST